MFDQLLAQLPIESEDKAQAQEIAPLIAMGEEVLAQGDAERALTIFRQIGDIAPDNAEALSGQIRALVAMGETERSEEHTSELQSLMRITYAVFCLKNKK